MGDAGRVRVADFVLVATGLEREMKKRKLTLRQYEALQVASDGQRRPVHKLVLNTNRNQNRIVESLVERGYLERVGAYRGFVITQAGRDALLWDKP